MSQSGPLPFLDFCGLEIANAARTLSYLRRGLGNTLQGHWEIGNGDVCSVLYRVDGSGCLPTVFHSPAADPAPWYDAAEPGAATFLGVVLLDIQGYDSTLTRAITPRFTKFGGGVFSRQHRNPRQWKFRAAMVSADDAGAEYGLRWLTQVLAASSCAQCSTCDITVRLTCPPDNCSDDSQGAWTSYECALTDGPHEVEQFVSRKSLIDQDVLAGCRDYVIVEWTMEAGNPYLYKQPHLCLHSTITQSTVCDDICSFLFGSSGASLCCAVTPPKRGVLGSVFSLYSKDGFGSLYLEGWQQCPGGSGPTQPELQLQISGVPAGCTVVVDSALHQITVTDASGNVFDGTYLVELQSSTGMPWLEVADCDDIHCFCVRPSEPCSVGTLEVWIQTQEREG